MKEKKMKIMHTHTHADTHSYDNDGKRTCDCLQRQGLSMSPPIKTPHTPNLT